MTSLGIKAHPEEKIVKRKNARRNHLNFCVARHKFLYYMEGSGYSMLVDGYKQNERKKALNQGPNASPSATPNKKWATA